MTIAYTIYQLPAEHPNCFMNHSYAMSHGGVNFNDYETIYTGEITGTAIDEILERMYTIFNTNHPDRYTGRSLSVSDIVSLENIGTYFCDSIGWKKIN